mgnify:CR=1 FL=1
MKTTLILVGKTNDVHISALCDEYVSRLSHYNLGFSITVIPDLKNTKNMSVSQQKISECGSILKQIQPGDYVVLLDEHGKELDSITFSKWINTKMNTVSKRLVFVIGGPYGFSEEMYARANEKLSLSKMTFSHQMFRLIFIEQVYRAMTILKGEPYHHE